MVDVDFVDLEESKLVRVSVTIDILKESGEVSKLTIRKELVMVVMCTQGSDTE